MLSKAALLPAYSYSAYRYGTCQLDSQAPKNPVALPGLTQVPDQQAAFEQPKVAALRARNGCLGGSHHSTDTNLASLKATEAAEQQSSNQSQKQEVAETFERM